MLEEALRFWHATSLCYNNKQINGAPISCTIRTDIGNCWALVTTLSPVVSACVLNQSRDPRLLGDALIAAISLSLQFVGEVGGTAHQLHSANQDFDADLEEFIIKMQQEVIVVLAPFLSFLTIYNAKLIIC